MSREARSATAPAASPLAAVVVAVLALTALLAPGAAAAPAVPPAPAEQVGAAPAEQETAAASVAVPAAPDYASERLSDPWDYTNPEDASVHAGVDSHGARNLRYEGGALRADVGKGGWLTLARAIGGSLPTGRDTRLQPLRAEDWSRLSLRMWSSTDTVMQVFWFSCLSQLPECQGVTQVKVTKGWQLYDVPLAGLSRWNGAVTSLRVVPAATVDAAVAVDFVRLYRPSPAARVSVKAPTSGTLVADVDTDPANGNSVRLRTVPTGTTSVDLSALAAGSWHLGVVSSYGRTSYVQTATVDAGPLPTVLQPDLAGGRSYAAVARAGDEWDFSQPGDVLGLANVASPSFQDGWLRGTNGPPHQNDPQVRMRLGATPIDGSRFHRLTVRLHHEGGFGLADAPGGGLMARVIWQTKGAPASYQDLEDVVLAPGTDTFTVDLATNPPEAVVDPTIRHRIGWAGQQVTSLRVDPNEDPGARRWRIDEVRVAEDDRPTDGAFDITFVDRGHDGGTTASVYVDRNGTGFDGTAVATGVRVQPGVNTVRWDTRGVADGRWWVYVVLDDGDQVRRAYSGGPVLVEASADRRAAFGSVDAVTAVPGGAEVSGWAVDPAATGGASDVAVLVDGRQVTTSSARLTRTDVARAHPAYGADHGYRLQLPGLAQGVRTVCVHAGTATGARLGCRAVTVRADPFGSLDGATRVPGGLRVHGWAIDGSTVAPTQVHVYGGSSARGGTASIPRTDVQRAHPRYGADHGYAVQVPVEAGRRTLCAYGIDSVAPGRNALLGCRTLLVSGEPVGRLDAVTRTGPGTVQVRGWALDPDTATSSQVHLWQGGRLVGAVTAATHRPDVGRAHPGYGSAHGFDAPVRAGTGRLCAYAVNARGAGSSTLLGCRDV